MAVEILTLADLSCRAATHIQATLPADTMAQIHETLPENERRNTIQHTENQKALKDGLQTVHKRLDRKDKEDGARAFKVSGWIISILTAAMGALMYGVPWG